MLNTRITKTLLAAAIVVTLSASTEAGELMNRLFKNRSNCAPAACAPAPCSQYVPVQAVAPAYAPAPSVMAAPAYAPQVEYTVAPIVMHGTPIPVQAEKSCTLSSECELKEVNVRPPCALPVLPKGIGIDMCREYRDLTYKCCEKVHGDKTARVSACKKNADRKYNKCAGLSVVVPGACDCTQPPNFGCNQDPDSDEYYECWYDCDYTCNPGEQ